MRCGGASAALADRVLGFLAVSFMSSAATWLVRVGWLIGGSFFDFGVVAVAARSAIRSLGGVWFGMTLPASFDRSSGCRSLSPAVVLSGSPSFLASSSSASMAPHNSSWFWMSVPSAPSPSFFPFRDTTLKTFERSCAGEMESCCWTCADRSAYLALSSAHCRL